MAVLAGMALPDTAASSVKREFYHELIGQAEALLDRETDALANAANFTALLYHSLAGINWAGFYFYRGGELVVGPFQGKPACVRIAMGKGVCGTAAQRRTAIGGALADSGLEVQDLFVQTVDAEASGGFGGESRDGIQEHLRVLIAAGHPGRRGGMYHGRGH